MREETKTLIFYRLERAYESLEEAAILKFSYVKPGRPIIEEISRMIIGLQKSLRSSK